jgi:hypothetical protein
MRPSFCINFRQDSHGHIVCCSTTNKSIFASPARVALLSWHTKKSCPTHATPASIWNASVFCKSHLSLGVGVLGSPGFSVVQFGCVAVISFWLSTFGFVWQSLFSKRFE